MEAFSQDIRYMFKSGAILECDGFISDFCLNIMILDLYVRCLLVELGVIGDRDAVLVVLENGGRFGLSETEISEKLTGPYDGAAAKRLRQ